MANKKMIYISGRMSGLPHDEMMKSRKNITAFLEELISIREADWKVADPATLYNYKNNVHKSEREIMQFELNLVRNSDIVIVKLEDINESIGSCIEVYEAYKNNIPVVAYGDDEDWYMTHPWIKECVSRREGSIEDACMYIADFYFW